MNQNPNLKMMQIVGAVQRHSESPEAEGQRPRSFWTRIGTALANRDHSVNLYFDYAPTRLDHTSLQVRDIDGKEPVLAQLLAGATRLQILGAVTRGEDTEEQSPKAKAWWTRIGIALLNRDGSLALLLDYMPTRLERTSVQLRKFDPKDEQEPAQGAA